MVACHRNVQDRSLLIRYNLIYTSCWVHSYTAVGNFSSTTNLQMHTLIDAWKSLSLVPEYCLNFKTHIGSKKTENKNIFTNEQLWEFQIMTEIGTP